MASKSSNPPAINCNRPCTPVCNTGTSACDAQNKQACDLAKQQAQACEDAAYDAPAETFVNMAAPFSWAPLFVIGSLFVIYGIIKRN